MVYTIEQIQEKINPLAEKYNLSAVYLFGSYARGEADENSDIDLVIVSKGSGALGFAFYKLYDELEAVFDDVEVDLMTMEGLLTNSTYIGKEVYKNFEKDKVLLYEKRAVGTGLFLS